MRFAGRVDESGRGAAGAPGNEKAFHEDGLTVAKPFPFPDQARS